MLCEYASGYADPDGDFVETEEETCDAVCPTDAQGKPERLACLATDAGPACVVRGGCVGGRRFETMAPFRAGGDRVDARLGAYFAEMAYLEAGSVTAFESLAEDLVRLDAPAWLVRRCLAAAKDEQRHAELMTDLAGRHGHGESIDAPAGRPPAHTLAELAFENAVEGTREAYGAFVVAWMARLAPAPVARTLRSIARDEARHAELSATVDAWARRSLDPASCASVDAARRRAVAELLAVAPDTALEELGADEPTQAAARGRLVALLRHPLV
jgi:hypothetical protein